MAQVVDAELHLVAVGGQGGRDGHDAGVQDEEVEARGGGEEGVGAGADRGQRGVVGF